MPEKIDPQELERRIREVEEHLKRKKSKASYTSSDIDEQPKRKEPADLNKIISVYESLLADGESMVEYYKAANSLIANKETIYKFVSLLPKYEKEKKFYEAGAFLSGLINNLEENEEVVLDLSNLNETMSFLGIMLHPHSLRIKGNVGWSLGGNVHSGKIIVEGNVEDHVGDYMIGGEIIVNGNVGEKAGDAMEGGKIIVNGNAGKHVGAYMKGGEIHLNGDYESISKKIEGGEVYHKGKRIFP